MLKSIFKREEPKKLIYDDYKEFFLSELKMI